MSKRGRRPKQHSVVNGVECKHCGGCDQWLPLESYAPSRKGKRTHDGLKTRCQDCIHRRGRDRRDKEKTAGHIPKLSLRPGQIWVRLAYFPDGRRVACKLYKHWDNMRKRCSGVYPQYHNSYTAKGIRICPEWGDYAVFRAWALSNGFRKGRTIDRINGNGNYEPLNCRWVTKREQQNNTSRTHILTLGGVTKPLTIWADELGLEPELLRSRLSHGWSHEHALTIPPGRLRPGTFRGRAAAKAKRLAIQ